MSPCSPRRALAALVVLLAAVLLVPGSALADPGGSATPPAGSWGAQLDSVAQWMARRGGPAPACTDHCFVLTRLRLRGAAGDAMSFSLEGSVLAPSPVAVPLFGPPGHARVDHVTENGQPAAVGFEGDHWYVVTGSKRFTIEGTITLDGDLALVVPGPLDALDADLSRGRVVEGAHLSGLQNATVHFDRDTRARPAAEPPVFQLARAVRIGRETTFEYRLVLRSGQDLGVVTLPLAFGEKVLDVQGATGWTVQGTSLVLPTAGRAATMTITGTLPSVGRFAPDARSSYEWWLVESDAEHRVQVAGDARQVEASESPIARTEPSAKLYLVSRGHHIDVTVQPLVATEVLAAVVRDQERTLVLTSRGDLVADDRLSYENDGIDWLALPTTGRAVFLATDGQAQRVMRQADGADEVLVPLRTGSHTLHVQSMSTASLGVLGGWLKVPTPTHALATSRARATIGLPAGVHPVAALGGDRPWFALGVWDAGAVAISIGLAWLALRGRARRALGAAALTGLWFVSPGGWEVLTIAAVVGAAAWTAARLFSGATRAAVWSLIGVVALTMGGVALEAGTPARAYRAAAAQRDLGGDATATVAAEARPAPAGHAAANDDDKKDGWVSGQSLDGLARSRMADVPAKAQAAAGASSLGGIVQGVAPVALTLPDYDRSVVVTRELVTRERPFTPAVVYVTDAGLAPLVGLWLACVALLARLCRGQIAAWVRAARERLSRRPALEPAPAAPTPDAPPPAVA